MVVLAVETLVTSDVNVVVDVARETTVVGV